MYNWYINNIIKWYKLMRWSINNIWSNMMIINGTFLGATWSANIKSLIGSDGYLNELPPESLSTSSCPWSAVRIHLNHQHVTFKSISNIIIRIIIWYNSINWSISSNTWCQWYISRIIIFNSHPNRIQKRYQYNNLTNNSIQIKRPLTIPKASDNYNTCKSKRDAADIERIKSVAAGLEPVYRDEPAEISQKRQLLNDKIIKNKPSSIDKSLYFPSATLYSNININYINSKSMIKITGPASKSLQHRLSSASANIAACETNLAGGFNYNFISRIFSIWIIIMCIISTSSSSTTTHIYLYIDQYNPYHHIHLDHDHYLNITKIIIIHSQTPSTSTPSTPLLHKHMITQLGSCNKGLYTNTTY
eukprot:210654_1